MNNIIKQWNLDLFLNNNISLEISNDFNLEDGMTLTDYLNYEQNNFNSYASIFDINTDFSIDIINEQKIDNKTIYYYYLVNHLGKIVFKNSLTINSKQQISSNNFKFQIVSKYIIEESTIKGIGLAIKSNIVEPLKIFSHSLELLDFNKGSNFEEDQFYSASFKLNSDIQNNFISLNIYYLQNNILTHEKRNVYFDYFDISLLPIKYDSNFIETIDEFYPVNLSVLYDNHSDNYSYPRNLKISTHNVKSIIVTDSIDNDWHFKIDISQ